VGCQLGALTAGDARQTSGDLIAYPIQDGRNAVKAQNGLGIGGKDEPSFTVDTTGAQSVAYSLRADPGAGNAHNVSYALAATLTAGAHGEGVSAPGRRSEDDINLVAEPMAFNPQTGGSKARLGYGDKPTALSCTQATAVAFSENQRGEVVESSAAHQLTTGGGKPGQGYPAVRTGTAVRRLTPLERERLQGFPDNWTRWRLEPDGREVIQSDAARDRQTGNAVAVPCVEWIARRLVATDARAKPPQPAVNVAPRLLGAAPDKRPAKPVPVQDGLFEPGAA